jgi:hypothetical protein
MNFRESQVMCSIYLKETDGHQKRPHICSSVKDFLQLVDAENEEKC